MSKDFAEGNQHGHEDGKTGNKHPILRQVKRTSLYIPFMGNFTDEYMRGYNQGFEDEVRLKYAALTFTTTPSPTAGENPMSQNTIAHQIELLQELKQYLANFQEKLLGVSANYQRKVDALYSDANLIDEIYRDYTEQQLEPTRALLAQLVDHISENDIPAIEKDIRWLESR